MPAEGIRIFGRLQRHVIIRENHTSGFNTGVMVELRGATPNKPMWIIADNLTEGATTVVVAPAQAQKTNNFA